MISISGLTGLIKGTSAMSNKLIGVSKSGIEVYEKRGKNGLRVLTSYKDGNIYKEITREATQSPKNKPSYFNTLIKNYDKDEYTTMTKYFEKDGNTISINSQTKAWNGKDDVTSLNNTPFKRYVSQSFKNKEITGLSKLENGRYTDTVYKDTYALTHKKGVMTFPNGQVHQYNYEKFEPYQGQISFSKRGIDGIEITNKGVNVLTFWNYSSAAARNYFKTH